MARISQVDGSGLSSRSLPAMIYCGYGLEGSGLSCRSLSAMISCGNGLDAGFRERASVALFRVPLIHCAVKLYSMILCLSRCSHGFSISSNL